MQGKIWASFQTLVDIDIFWSWLGTGFRILIPINLSFFLKPSRIVNLKRFEIL